MDQISVVIPTQRRLSALSRTLAELARQDLGRVSAELVIVCSGADARYRERVADLASGHPLPARVLARREGGAAGARNEGVGAAESDLVLFLNDDTPPLSRDLVRAHAELHDDEEEWLGVLGPVVWDDRVELTPVMAWMDRSGKMNDYSGVTTSPQRPTLYAPNLSARSEALRAVGGFDERFWRYGWAEYDLALRLFDRGFRIRFEPAIVVGHDHVYSLRDSLRRMDSVGRGANLINRVHRERAELDTPRPSGAKAAIARSIAPLAARLPVPGWLPSPVQDFLFRALHYATLARGYARDPLPEGAGRAGGIPGRAEPIA